MIEFYKKVVFENYANFKGRATRSEYWYYTLCSFLILTLLIVIGAIIGTLIGDTEAGAGFGYLAYFLYALATLVPSLAVFVRRMHDTGKSGWSFLFGLIPFGGIVILVFLFTEGTRGSNQYGTDPKSQIEEIDQIGKE